MVNLPRKFIWLGKDGNHGTHLNLVKNEIYNSSSISTGILINWMKEGKLKFIADEPGETLPKDVVLDVKKGTIPMKDLLDHIDKGLKKGN